MSLDGKLFSIDINFSLSKPKREASNPTVEDQSEPFPRTLGAGRTGQASGRLFFIGGVGWDWVHLVRRPPVGPEYHSSWWNDNWQRKPKYWEKNCPWATFLPQIPHNLTRDRTWATGVGSRLLAIGDMAWPSLPTLNVFRRSYMERFITGLVRSGWWHHCR
jgi:hypothetical protein